VCAICHAPQLLITAQVLTVDGGRTDFIAHA
jgi:putative intracellular protease/amidase